MRVPPSNDILPRRGKVVKRQKELPVAKYPATGNAFFDTYLLSARLFDFLLTHLPMSPANM